MDSHGTDIPAESPAEPAEPGEPVSAQAQAGAGTDYAGAGYPGQVPPAENATEDSDAAMAGRPPAADETLGRGVSDEAADEPVSGVVEDDVVVLETEEPAGYPASAGVAASPGATTSATSGATTSAPEQWSEIKAGFVDDPSAAVKLAAGQVERAIGGLMTSVRQRQDSLFPSRQGGDATDTEELRKALQGYRGLFEQLDQMTRQFAVDQGRVAGRI